MPSWCGSTPPAAPSTTPPSLAGAAETTAYALAVDAAGRATVTGFTHSSDFPTTPGAFDTSYNGDTDDAFVVRLNAAGSALDYATFLGGSDCGLRLRPGAGRSRQRHRDGLTAPATFPPPPAPSTPATTATTTPLSSLCRLSCHPPSPLHGPPPPIVDGNLSDWGQWSPLVLNRDTASYVATQPPAARRPPPLTTAPSFAPCGPAPTSTLRSSSATTPSSTTARHLARRRDRAGLRRRLDGNPAGGDTHQYTVNADGRITDFGHGHPAHPGRSCTGVRRLERRGAHPGHPPLRPQRTAHRRQDDGLRPGPARRRRRRQLGQPHDLGWRQHLLPCRRPAAPGRRRRADAAAHQHANATAHRITPTRTATPTATAT